MKKIFLVSFFFMHFYAADNSVLSPLQAPPDELLHNTFDSAVEKRVEIIKTNLEKKTNLALMQKDHEWMRFVYLSVPEAERHKKKKSFCFKDHLDVEFYCEKEKLEDGVDEKHFNKAKQAVQEKLKEVFSQHYTPLVSNAVEVPQSGVLNEALKKREGPPDYKWTSTFMIGKLTKLHSCCLATLFAAVVGLTIWCVVRWKRRA